MNSMQPITASSDNNGTASCCHKTIPARFIHHVVKKMVNRIIHYLINPVIEYLNRHGILCVRPINEFVIHPAEPEIAETVFFTPPDPPRPVAGYQCPITGQCYETLEDYLASGDDAEIEIEDESAHEAQCLRLERVRHNLGRIRYEYCAIYGEDAWENNNIEEIASSALSFRLDGRHYRFIREMSPVINNVFRYILGIVNYLEKQYPQMCDDAFNKNVKYFKDRGRFFTVPRHEDPNALLVRIPHAACNVESRLYRIESALDNLGPDDQG